MSAPFEIKRISVDSSTWTAITAPFACSRAVLRLDDLANNMKVRTNSSDANTQDQIQGGVDFLLNTAQIEQSVINSRHLNRPLWAAGDTICFVQTTAGTGPVVLKVTS